ncbi:cytochrome P450 [Micromonospora sonneratiae]|uniref:Cytochrome P450 n=1 Tax=Micromonospora sonneratiae TaxID=1184706 RepID=A0ABW3YBR9_9ACTN
MTAATMIDLADTDVFVANRHHELLRRLRQESPVHWNQSGDGGFWALTRYGDVVDAYRQHDLFSSAYGAIMGGSFQREKDSASGLMLVASDQPQHRQLRRMLHPAFDPVMVRRIAERVRQLVDRALAAMKAAGGCDIATDFVLELPAGALMVAFGIGRADALHLVGLTRRMICFRDASAVGTAPQEQRLVLAQVQAEIFGFFAELLEERRTSPGDDVISMMLRADINGRPVTDEQILYNCMNIAVGGNETSSHSTCAGILAFIEHPQQWDRLCQQPQLMRGALEEVLRWSSANAYVQRVALRDVEVRGVTIAAGDVVTLWNASANRDEDEFAQPDRFDITRSPNRHLSFGSGSHRCIGAPTGDAEMTEAFSALLGSGLRLRLAGEVIRMRSNFILGFTSMPVEVGG